MSSVSLDTSSFVLNRLCLPIKFIALSINFCPSDYKEGFGGKFGIQTDRQDKSALGWDHIEKVDKHESQKGEHCPHLFGGFSFVLSRQITKLDLVESSEFRTTGLTNLRLDGNTTKRWTNTNLRKV